MKQFYIFFFFVCVHLLACRPMELDAKVVNQKMEPVPNATVRIKRTNASAHSDNKGKVHLSNLYLNDTLVVHAEGYKTYEEEYEWRRGKQTFVLEPQ